MKQKLKRNKGITLIALILTIIVLLILAVVAISAVTGNGIIAHAKNARELYASKSEEENALLQNYLEQLNKENANGDYEEENALTIKSNLNKVLSTTVNTKLKDEYGNKITVPAGFKILEHGTTAGSPTYTYSGNNIPTVQDGIVIEDTRTETAGDQFIWVPVGTIKNKDSLTNTITLGRYSDFTATNGVHTPAQRAENFTQEVVLNSYYKELTTSRISSSDTENTTARNLTEFISTTLANGGYYIARFEASGTTSKITSKYNQTVLTRMTQPNAAKLARDMYGEVKNADNKLIYASDLINSYAWDTAIIFIQTYSEISDYADQNKSTSLANTGINSDKYCNIWDMSGNAMEWTTEYSTASYDSHLGPCVIRGGYFDMGSDEKEYHTSGRYGGNNTAPMLLSSGALRPILYVK